MLGIIPVVEDDFNVLGANIEIVEGGSFFGSSCDHGETVFADRGDGIGEMSHKGLLVVRNWTIRRRG